LNISVIVPVYNGEETIGKCLYNLVNQDFPKDQYEIIVVNDGSTDNTVDIIEKYAEKYNIVKLITLDQNKGRIIARITGAKSASYDLLLFVDSRRIATNDLLINLERIEYQPIVQGQILESQEKDSLYERVLYLFRRKYYFSEVWNSKVYWINKHNFDRSPKGTGCLLIDRNLFLECQPSDKGRHVNDDTKILKQVVKHKPILRHQDVKVKYIARNKSKSALKHIFYRGIRFQDYYLCPEGIYYKYFVTSVIVGLLLVTLSVFAPSIWLYYILVLILGFFGVSFYLFENGKDFFLVLFSFPLIAFTFISGILYGKVRLLFSVIKKIHQSKSMD